jgi:outer membrane murein-binding lipoprotein Lpp
VALLTLFLCVVAIPTQSQESSSPDVQEMKTKLQQLEQQVQALQRQIGATQQSQISVRATSPPAVTEGLPSYEKPPEATEAEASGGKNSIDLYGFVMVDTGYVRKPTRLV